MKLLAGIVIGCAISASGATAGFDHQGIHCEQVPRSVVCVKTDGTGYGVGMNRATVVVTNEKGKIVFSRKQP